MNLNLHTDYENWDWNSNGSALISNDSLSFKINKNETLDNDYLYFNLINDSLTINDIEYSKELLNSATSGVKNSIEASAALNNIYGEIINLGINGFNKSRNDAILNSLIDVLTR